ncbi:pectinesterase-like [Magnolia sinica]|uniref:pectinesterase-like n=1 Tax=Magnolia sinica TaxID=86752 RepID=UPI00265AC9DD|nr:pectinesterase-like [Magnolia sinica]
MDKLTLYFFSVCLFSALRVLKGDKISSCSQTPYPEICDSLISTTPLSTLDDTQFGFRDLALQATVDHAEQAYQLMSNMDLFSLDDRAKMAWTDCVELFEDTISHLNRSLGSTNPGRFEDAQTWLSAAVANEQTCQNGFIELNSTSHLASLPIMFGNISKLLSNSLAINKAVATSTAALSSKSGGGRRLLAGNFPNWVSATERKLLQSSTTASKADLVVAKDGSGNYKTISEAVAASSKLRSGTKRFIIYVKAGVYSENVEIKKMKNLMFIGDGIDATIVTSNKNVQDGSTTFRSATFAVTGDGFIARDMTFQNTAGPQKHQAVALRSGADFSVFYKCSFKGYQDTLYVYSQRQFYRDCDIYGTIDFIFGDAAAVIQNCNIYVRRPMSNQKNTVTAQGRSDPNENTGISIHNSRIMAASDLRPVQGSINTYLGRPWKKYSRTVIMKTDLGDLINPAGWLEWSGSFGLSTLYYGEYMNTGSGAATGRRVKWAGFHVITSAAEAGKYTAGSFLGGGSWIPASGVPYTSGL